MRPSHVAVSLLVLLIFLSSVQGNRLDKSFKTAILHPELHESAVKKNSMGDVILCKEEHCTGKGRKLLTATSATTTPTITTTSKREENGENKDNPTSKVKSRNEEKGGKQEKLPVGSTTGSEHQAEVHDQYVDISDIAEMDYSPANRKSPIHN